MNLLQTLISNEMLKDVIFLSISFKRTNKNGTNYVKSNRLLNWFDYSNLSGEKHKNWLKLVDIQDDDIEDELKGEIIEIKDKISDFEHSEFFKNKTAFNQIKNIPEKVLFGKNITDKKIQALIKLYED